MCTINKIKEIYTLQKTKEVVQKQHPVFVRSPGVGRPRVTHSLIAVARLRSCTQPVQILFNTLEKLLTRLASNIIPTV